MSQKLIEQARQAVRWATKLGAQGVRASISRGRNARLEWREGKLDRLRESTRMGLSISLYVDGRYSANATSDLRPTAVQKFLEQTVATTRVLARDPHRQLAPPERCRNPFQGDLQLYDAGGLTAVGPSQRQRAVKAMEAAARSAPGAGRIVSVNASAWDSDGESGLVCSNGMEGTRRATSFGVSTVVYVQDKGHRKPVGWWYAVDRHRSALPALELVGREATRRALAEVGGKPLKSGEHACIVENAVLSRLLRGLLAPLRGSAIQQKRSFLADKIGAEVTSPLLSITDTPHLVRGLGSRTFDYEGMSTRTLPVFERGVLRSFYLDTYYASKLGQKPTTATQGNLVFSKGTRDLQGLMKAMGTGILVTGFSGGNSNPATGDFSVGIRGQWVDLLGLNS